MKTGFISYRRKLIIDQLFRLRGTFYILSTFSPLSLHSFRAALWPPFSCTPFSTLLAELWEVNLDNGNPMLRNPSILHRMFCSNEKYIEPPRATDRIDPPRRSNFWNKQIHRFRCSSIWCGENVLSRKPSARKEHLHYLAQKNRSPGHWQEVNIQFLLHMFRSQQERYIGPGEDLLAGVNGRKDEFDTEDNFMDLRYHPKGKKRTYNRFKDH